MIASGLRLDLITVDCLVHLHSINGKQIGLKRRWSTARILIEVGFLNSDWGLDEAMSLRHFHRGGIPVRMDHRHNKDCIGPRLD